MEAFCICVNLVLVVLNWPTTPPNTAQVSRKNPKKERPRGSSYVGVVGLNVIELGIASTPPFAHSSKLNSVAHIAFLGWECSLNDL